MCKNVPKYVCLFVCLHKVAIVIVDPMTSPGVAQ